ncbi:hypothetical protein [Methyloraptor flagellatus]|uniref:DUF2157 domain-containing protein n=1 Tax=Methyloraptor flagellatus TaxID=3162530 RepID=A0AAU7XB29_9HYPH
MRPDDLAAAVAAGILDRATADRLAAFLKARADADDAASEGEVVEVARNFNEVFLSIGVILFCIGVAVAGALVFMPLVVWGLAEALRLWRRTRLPMIVLAAGFALGIVIDANVFAPDGPWSVTAAAGAALVGSVLFGLRFGVPFAAGLAAAAGAVVTGTALYQLAPGFAAAHALKVVAVYGLATFAVAMAFDASDPHRRTARAAAGFWLHMIAAAALVHGVLGQFAEGGAGPFGLWAARSIEPSSAWAIIALAALLVAVALVVDRRALLVSALSYLAGVVFLIARASSLSGETPVAVALTLVGLFVLVLGIAWRPVRGFVMKPLPDALKNRLPPQHI